MQTKPTVKEDEKTNTLEIDVDSRKQFTGYIPEDDESSGILGAIGSSISLISDRKMPFTHELACKHLELEEFDGERKLEDDWVSALISCAQSGTFHPEWVTWITAHCEQNGKDYRENGQHTAWMRLAMPKDWKGAGEIRYQRYLCKTIDDARILYASIDRNRARNRAMVMNSYLAGTEEFSGITKTLLGRLASGLTFWLWDTKHFRDKHSADHVAGVMRTKYMAITQTVAAFMIRCGSKRDSRFVMRAPALAAVFATFDKAAKASVEFWEAVIEGTGMTSPNDPRLRLRNFLITTIIGRRDRKSGSSRVVVAEELYRCCIHAFNAWRKGEELQTLRAPLDSKRPVPR